MGERYGYRLHSSDGFNYITGGGGIVFSLSVVKKLVNNCSCPSDSSPDDMIIAMCLQRLGIPSIHSSKFHQVMDFELKQKFRLNVSFFCRLVQLIIQRLHYKIQFHFINFGKLIHIWYTINGFDNQTMIYTVQTT